MLANALMAGICSVGADAVYAGVVPTPAVAYLTKAKGFDAGVVISASHNPMEFNGIKFFSSDGYKLPDEVEDEIQKEIESNMASIDFPTGAKDGRITYDFDIDREYIDFEKAAVPVDLSGLKVVVDCANGASYKTNTAVLRELGADLIPLHVEPNGTNINDKCGSTHLEDLMATVKKKAQISVLPLMVTLTECLQ
jgi:phosphoglucosamine mutase